MTDYKREEKQTENINQRPIGLAKGQFKIPDSFFEPLPDDILDGFEGMK